MLMLTSQLPHPVSNNLLQSKEDMQYAMQQLCRPLIAYYSTGKSRLKLGVTGAGHSEDKAGIEGFSRVLWGLVPLVAGGGESELWDICLEGIRNGTNPSHAEYWGEAGNFDQLLVEMAAFGFGLLLAPEQIWGPLDVEERQRFYDWLNQINKKKLHDCNWLFFQVIVNVGFKNIGMPYDTELMASNLDRIDTFYLGNGWYSDGEQGHCDYYGPFAIHYYSLLYAKFMEEEDPQRSSLYKERAALFAQQFIYWFTEEGDALPYGRSLTYRFSQSAFWSALVYAGVEPFPMGVMKGLIIRNLRWWLNQPIFHADGTLSIGYSYPNLVMSENYNATGSPYWALKTFLPLALEEDHQFWSVPELPLPVLEPYCTQIEPRMIVYRQHSSDHVLAFNAGNKATNEHTHTSAKYEKFVYSNAFGFSVPRAEWGLAQSACDSMLALSEGDNLFRVKRKIEEYWIKDKVIYMSWKPWHDVEVQTWLVAGAPWHVRVHCITSARPIDAADGGFALGISNERWQEELLEKSALVHSSYGASGVTALYGWNEAVSIQPNANTNVIHPRTHIPFLTASLPSGTTWLASGIYGQPGDTCLTEWHSSKPTVELKQQQLIVRTGDASNHEFLRIAQF